MTVLRLALIGLVLSFNVTAAENTNQKNSEAYSKIKETYGKYNLSAKPAFQGWYINFGYWKGIELDNAHLLA